MKPLGLEPAVFSWQNPDMISVRALAACTVIVASLGASCWGAAAPADPRRPVTPTSILAHAPAADWTRIDPKDLLVLDFDGQRRVVIALADGFAPVHADNIRKLARAHWYDGLAVERVQDNYVVQWGDPDGKKVLPANVINPAPAEYERSGVGVPLAELPYRDTYADRVGAWGVFPVAEDAEHAWITHCYGVVGVGRDLNPDTGTGAELYAVIGQPPRALDRNIAVVGRVLSGMDMLSALPRGGGDMGFYTDPGQRLRLLRVRVAVDLPVSEQPRFERLRETSPSYRAWAHARANRQDDFFVRPAGSVDVCNVLPPVRALAP